MHIRLCMLAALTATWFSAGHALAQSAPTCSFDEGTRTLNVLVDGDPATLSVGPSGAIKLNGVTCAGATTTTTDLIRVEGGVLNDKVTVDKPGTFVPGPTTETTGMSEIEISFVLGDGVDSVTLTYTDGPDVVRLRGSGVDVHDDGDADVWTTDAEFVKVKTWGGDDRIIARAYLGLSQLFLYGGSGNDSLVAGAPGMSRLYGEDGDDELFAESAATTFHYGGAGNDSCFGWSGKDIFVADATYDGDDAYYGNTGRDTIDYSKRTNGVSVTPDDGLANDGEPGEADLVDVEIENLTGGSGDDTLIGTSKRNTLTGNAGADSLYGGPDVDKFYGGEGDDVIFNDDGVNNETVNCGPGIDDPQPSNDNFTACELI